jgi:uncharacterized membrane protein
MVFDRKEKAEKPRKFTVSGFFSEKIWKNVKKSWKIMKKGQK